MAIMADTCMSDSRILLVSVLLLARLQVLLHVVLTGHFDLLALPTTSSEFGRHAFSYFAPLLWNNLPSPLRSVHSLDLFKFRLKI